MWYMMRAGGGWESKLLKACAVDICGTGVARDQQDWNVY